ncbi:MAG: hypothetical protein ABIR52_08435 [Casimicrobiaceae bacterium]
MIPSRRNFIFVGVAGAAALATVRLWPREAPRPGALGADGVAVMSAIAPVMLAGALPGGGARETALNETLVAIESAVAGLAPRAQAELGDLFALLALAPARWSLAGMTASWQSATPADVARFLDRLRESRIELLRAAYDALHQLVMAAWYGNPRAWPAIGYGGPPVLG